MRAASSDVDTLPGVPVPTLVRAHQPSDESAVLDVLAELRAAAAALRASASAAEVSAQLTLTQKSAKRRGQVAIASTVAAIVYAVVDVFAPQAGLADRVDALEQKLDDVAADVAAIADAVASGGGG